MKKIIVLLFLWLDIGYSCATCMFMVPSVDLDLKLDIEGKQLKKVDFEWHFSEVFTNEMVKQFDKNRNQQLDQEELDEILEAKLDYLQPKQMVTLIHYADQNTSEALVLTPTFEYFSIKILNKALHFSYTMGLQKVLSDQSSLSLSLQDDEGYFIFKMRRLQINPCDFAYSKNLYDNTATMLFRDKSLIHEMAAPVLQKHVEVVTAAKAVTEEQEGLQESLLKETMEMIKSLFVSIKDEKNPMTYLLLLFFAYLYGVIHAMGPGHGKTLVASYFLSNDRSYTKAFFISLAIGMVHTFSAFILTLVIYFIVNALLAQFLDEAVYYTTKISALIIIGIALYLIHKKYRFYKSVREEQKITKFTFSSSPVHDTACGCGSCKVDKNSTDFALIISAGIIPCPGTTAIFIFALSTGLYYAGFISALVMSLGMSSIIFFSALLSTMIRKRVDKSSAKLKTYLEFISLAFILVLGGVLLFA